VLVPQSKTDPFGKGQVIGIPRGAHEETCPVRALEAWLAAAGIAEGYVFRAVDRWGRLGDAGTKGGFTGRRAAHLHPAVIARIIKDRCAAANLTPEIFSGHSLRRGFVTSARAAGADWSDIRRQTRHKSVTVAEGYETAEVCSRAAPQEGVNPTFVSPVAI
jgi:integrase